MLNAVIRSVHQTVSRLVCCAIVWLCDSIGSDDGIWIRYSMQRLNSWYMNDQCSLLICQLISESVCLLSDLAIVWFYAESDDGNWIHYWIQNLNIYDVQA